MIVEVVTTYPCEINETCPFEGSCGQPATTVIASSERSQPFAVCPTHLPMYLGCDYVHIQEVQRPEFGYIKV